MIFTSDLQSSSYGRLNIVTVSSVLSLIDSMPTTQTVMFLSAVTRSKGHNTFLPTCMPGPLCCYKLFFPSLSPPFPPSQFPSSHFFPPFSFQLFRIGIRCNGHTIMATLIKNICYNTGLLVGGSTC
jgi:hypothetical protein